MAILWESTRISTLGTHPHERTFALALAALLTPPRTRIIPPCTARRTHAATTRADPLGIVLGVAREHNAGVQTSATTEQGASAPVGLSSSRAVLAPRPLACATFALSPCRTHVCRGGTSHHRCVGRVSCFQRTPLTRPAPFFFALLSIVSSPLEGSKARHEEPTKAHHTHARPARRRVAGAGAG